MARGCADADQLNMDNTKIGERPLRWFLSGWRAGIFLLFLAALLPWVLDPSLQVTAINIGIYVMLALGLNIVVGYAGLLDLGYVAFFVIGAYTVAGGSFGFIQWPMAIPNGPVVPVLGAAPGGRSTGWPVRHAPRRANAPVARRLSGHRDTRLWRDRADRLPERAVVLWPSWHQRPATRRHRTNPTQSGGVDPSPSTT